MKIRTLAGIVALTFTLAACSKVSKENYETLSVGMDYDEVTKVIGDPDNCSETLGTKSCTWGDDSKNIKVTFAGSKAMAFSNNGL